VTYLLQEAALLWLANQLARGRRHTLLEPMSLGGYSIYELRGPLREVHVTDAVIAELLEVTG